jgi:hypothetical protein
MHGDMLDSFHQSLKSTVQTSLGFSAFRPLLSRPQMCYLCVEPYFAGTWWMVL